MNYKAAEFILNFCLCLSYRFQAPGCQETCVPFLSAPAPSASRSATLSRKGCWHLFPERQPLQLFSRTQGLLAIILVHSKVSTYFRFFFFF